MHAPQITGLKARNMTVQGNALGQVSRLVASPERAAQNSRRHFVLPFQGASAESQRDSGTKPRVARNELPWETAVTDHNPNGVAAHPRELAATPLGLKTFRFVTQGSSFLATLGWRTQSRWDCKNADGAGSKLVSCAAEISRTALRLNHFFVRGKKSFLKS